MNPAKKIVVIGGGIAGAQVVKALQFDGDLTLIDPKDYFEISWASLRCKVEPEFAERSIFSHKEYLSNGRLVVSSVVGATESEVITASGESVPYDYLVIATGTTFDGPSTRKERIEQLEADNQKIRNSKKILLIGGGPVGVELAAEIKVDYPEKEVILVHSGSRLIEFLGPKASQKAFDWLTANDIQVYLNERIDFNSLSDSSSTFTTSTGREFTADCHFVCIGKRVGSSWIQDTIFKDVLEKDGHLRVDENLRVLGKENVFAVGDIVNVKENKQGFSAQKHAGVVARNVKKLLSDPRKKMDVYKPAGILGIVSLGRHDAVSQLPFTTVVGCIPGRIKSRDLFVGKTRKSLGLNP